MYTEITAVEYDETTTTLTIEGIDLDAIMLNDWSEDFDDVKPTKFRFDLSQRGPRIYLYKICKSSVKEACSSMMDQVMALKGKVLNISGNFIAGAEG